MLLYEAPADFWRLVETNANVYTFMTWALKYQGEVWERLGLNPLQTLAQVAYRPSVRPSVRPPVRP